MMRKKVLKNRLNKMDALAKVAAEPFARRTVSFYKYVRIADPAQLREDLFEAWESLGVLGRIYVSTEGINAQICVPEPQWDVFQTELYEDPRFAGVGFKIAVEEAEPSFWKLAIAVKHRIVADGLEEEEIDLQQIGEHINAPTVNAAIADPDAMIIDMRNHYEYEIGHFEGAVCPNTATFREALPEAVKMAEDHKNKPVVLYCTGGIRCEKASAYFRAKGFEKVSQVHGGIIQYAHEVEQNGLPNKYKGKNFVFDGRRAEAISEEIISQCHQCGSPCDHHVNCINTACHLLFLQCDHCHGAHGRHCSPKCRDICGLPIEEQQVIRRSVRDHYGRNNAETHYAPRDLTGQIW